MDQKDDNTSTTNKMSISERLDKLYERMQLEFDKQTLRLNYSLIQNLSRRLDEKVEPLWKENKALKSEIEYLEKKVEYLERDSKRNNIIIFGFEENETCVSELIEAIRLKIASDLDIYFSQSDVNNAYRVGKRNSNSTKPRPVVVTFLTAWKRNQILRNKKRFRNIYVSEDFPKLVVEKRKLWLKSLKEERKKGKIAYLVYDKLIIKPGRSENNNEEEVKEEGRQESDSSQLLDEQCDKEENNTVDEKPRRRAKAMTLRNAFITPEDKIKNDEEKLKQETSVPDEEYGEDYFRKAFEKFMGETMKDNKKVSIPKEGMEEKINEKTKSQNKKPINKNDKNSSDENDGEEEQKQRDNNLPDLRTQKKIQYGKGSTTDNFGHKGEKNSSSENDGKERQKHNRTILPDLRTKRKWQPIT